MNIRAKKPKKVKKAVLARWKKEHLHLYKAAQNPTPKHRLGANVTTFRLRKGMTQKALAAKAKVPHPVLKKIEEAHPRSNPTQSVIEKIALALHVDVIDLYRFMEQSESIIR
ncbi:MAG TPA: helix-turn-helix transcriptional regulator [bacterium]|nr:helix-turn-helix transcriptional regulator [bacterium]